MGLFVRSNLETFSTFKIGVVIYGGAKWPPEWSDGDEERTSVGFLLNIWDGSKLSRKDMTKSSSANYLGKSTVNQLKSGLRRIFNRSIERFILIICIGQTFVSNDSGED